MPTTVRDEVDQLYAEWQLSARQRGKLHDFLRAIARARLAADAADELGIDTWTRLAQCRFGGRREARLILTAARR